MAEWQLLGIVAAAIYSVVAPVTIWAGLSKRHWFLRFAVVGGVLSVGLTIPAYDAVLVFLIHSVVVIAGLIILKCLRARARAARADAESNEVATAPDWLQFSLRDLLLAIVIVSAVFALLANVPAKVWAEWRAILFFGGSFGMSTLALFLWAVGPLRRKAFGKEKMTGWKKVIARMVGVGSTLAMVLMLVVGAGVYYRAINPMPIPKTELPDPNGYDTLMQAGRQLDNVTIPDAETATLPALRVFLTTYGHVLDAARAGLDQESCVLLEFSEADLYSPFTLRCQKMGRAFIADGRLAEAEGHGADAAETYLDTIRLGDVVARGGLLVHSLVGWELKRKGMNALYGMRSTLTREQCCALIDRLQAIEADRESLEDIEARDTLWSNRARGKKARALATFSAFWEPLGSNREAAQRTANFHKARVRLLICELALGMYRVERAGQPRDLAELVPEFLPAVPEDPFSGKPLIYRPNSTDYLLYSIGPDGHNDDGQPLDFSRRLGDVLLGEQPKAEDP